MIQHFKENREAMIHRLKAAQFSDVKIERALNKIMHCSTLKAADNDRAKQSQLFSKVTAAKTVYTAIVCETLASLIRSWNEDHTSAKRSLSNKSVKTACIQLYDEVLAILNSRTD